MQGFSDRLEMPLKKRGNFLDIPSLMAQTDDFGAIFDAL